jgi:hypothetical protein
MAAHNRLFLFFGSLNRMDLRISEFTTIGPDICLYLTSFVQNRKWNCKN